MFRHLITDGLHGMNDGAVVTTTKMIANGFQRQIRFFFSQIHGHLPGVNQFTFAAFGFQVGNGHVEIAGNGFLYRIDGYFPFGVDHNVAQGLLGQFEVNFPAIQGCLRHQRHNDTFQFPNVCIDAVSQVFDHRIVNINTFGLKFFLDNGNTRFEVGRLQIGRQAPFEARQ